MERANQPPIEVEPKVEGIVEVEKERKDLLQEAMDVNAGLYVMHKLHPHDVLLATAYGKSSLDIDNKIREAKDEGILPVEKDEFTVQVMRMKKVSFGKASSDFFEGKQYLASVTAEEEMRHLDILISTFEDKDN